MFEIHDDIEVLKRMGMAFGLESGKCPPEDLKVARSLVPKALEPYVIGRLNNDRFRTESSLFNSPHLTPLTLSLPVSLLVHKYQRNTYWFPL